MSFSSLKEYFKSAPEKSVEEGKNQEARPSVFSRFWFQITLAFVITLINYILTYSSKRLDLINLYYFLSDLLMSFLVLRFFMFCTNKLESLVSWDKSPGKRLILQLSVISPLLALFNILINKLTELIFYTGRVDLGFYTFDMVVALLFILIVQFLYISLHFIQNRPQASVVLREKSVAPPLKAAIGKQTVLVPQTECLLIFVHANISYVVNKEQKHLILDLPLKDVEEKLDDRFFRANRQFIVSKEAIAGYKSLDFGKLEVSLASSNKLVPDTLTISRNNAASFRQWIKV